MILDHVEISRSPVSMEYPQRKVEKLILGTIEQLAVVREPTQGFSLSAPEQRLREMFGSRLWSVFRSSRSLVQHVHQTRLLSVNSFKSAAEISCSVHVSEESVIKNIKESTDTLDVLNIIARNRDQLNHEQVLQTLKTLFVLQKSGHSSLEAMQIQKHPAFEKLCRKLKSNARLLELNDIIEMLKILSFLGVSANSEISLILLNLIRYNVNNVTLGHIVFLDFLLTKMTRTPLIEALQMALPMIFQIQIGTKIDYENVPQLVDLLLFISRNRVSEKAEMNVITALIMQGENLSGKEAKRIMWSLCTIKHHSPSHIKLINNCLVSMTKELNTLTFDDIETTISKMIDKFVYKNDAFYDECFFNECIETVIEKEISFCQTMYLLKRFNKISFISFKLLDYVAAKVVENPHVLYGARPTDLFTFISAFSTANYRAANWDEVVDAFEQNGVMQSTRNEFPWMKFTLELMSLDYYRPQLLNRIFSEEFLAKHLARDFNTLDYIQFLSLYQSATILKKYPLEIQQDNPTLQRAVEITIERSDFPLTMALQKAFDGSPTVVFNKLKTRYGHLIDHAIVFDRKTKTPIEVDTPNDMLFENLQNSNCLPVAILSMPQSHYAHNVPRMKGIFQLKIRTLEALAISVVAINVDHWNRLPEHERIDYLKREILIAVE